MIDDQGKIIKSTRLKVICKNLLINKPSQGFKESPWDVS
jgi:hypothetical protein